VLQNSLVLVGRLLNTPVISEIDDKKYTVIDLIITETKESISIYLYDSIAENVVKYCKEDDLMGIKGHLDIKDKVLKVVADKVTFLASKSKEGDE